VSTQTVAFDRSGLGVWTEEQTLEVTREALVRYALATNDPLPAHRAGDLAPPVFAIVPVFLSLLAPALEVVPVSLFGRILHGEQDFRFHRPIVPGDVLRSRGRMTGWEGRPNGTRACVHLESRDAAGVLVTEQYVTFFVRGHDEGGVVGELAPGHRLDAALRDGAPAVDAVQHVDDDQTFRYAEAAGDPMPIHLDEDAARHAGLPGIIAHGLCVLAFASWGLLDGVGEPDARRLRRLAVRFAKPVLPGQDLRTRAWPAGAGTYAYETTVDGVPVLRDGLVVLGDEEA
jgi:acyl dehydratase